MNSSSANFLSTYLILPILNAKSLMDISKIDCSENPRKHGNEVSDFLGLKIRVQYSLYVGDDKDIIHTISLRVPDNYSAFEVMELAASIDPKFKFHWKTMSGKWYVYQIANIVNDPEAGRFWLSYVGAVNDTESLTHFITSTII
ncbi:uncharacterized protein NPIL_510861 [Nephila pilipes]|uniref:Uncharacterized protein n=1 Tax=Nephila pilipes TaxID=299642 RepID=A0A8X6PHX1_NEPPI|nr:uncharacterized protein NPIL_510861 [Nephila pilipes]